MTKSFSTILVLILLGVSDLQGGQNFHFPIDFAGHSYNSAAATAQPVITG